MAKEFNPDTNPNLIDVYLLALKEKESSNRYNLTGMYGQYKQD